MGFRAIHKAFSYVSVQFSSVTQSCPTLCDPMDRSTPASGGQCMSPDARRPSDTGLGIWCLNARPAPSLTARQPWWPLPQSSALLSGWKALSLLCLVYLHRSSAPMSLSLTILSLLPTHQDHTHILFHPLSQSKLLL